MEQSSSSKGSNGAIIGGTIGGILFVSLLYAIYYYFIRVPKYEFINDYPVVLTNNELGFFRQAGEAVSINAKSFKKGDIVIGTKNPDGTLTVSLDSLGFPNIKRNIPIEGNLNLINKWF